MNKIKTGIMGGTFDPIHFGHLILAQTAMEQFDLDEVLVMPAKAPPHKSRNGITPAAHRIAMTRLAIAGSPGFRLSLFEMEREGYTYTYETLQLLTSQNPDRHYYFIMGADSLFDFQKWRNPQIIASLCTILVANRSEEPDRELLEQIEYICREYGGDVRLLRIPALEISSRALRDKVRKCASIRYYTPDAVVDYIQEHRLYLSQEENHLQE